MLLTMLGLLLLQIAAAAAAKSAPAEARATTVASVRIVRAAEIRDGRTSTPHRRRVVRDETGERRIILDFE